MSPALLAAAQFVIGPISFLAPLALLGLLALPLIWWILQIAPPRPKEAEFPPLRILQDVMTDEETPDSTPLWLLLYRLLLAALIAIALAAPIIGAKTEGTARPLALVIDTGWDAAPNWTSMMRTAEARIAKARRDNLEVMIVLTEPAQNGRTNAPKFGPAEEAMQQVKSLRPTGLASSRAAAAERLEGVDISGAQALWLSSGLDFGSAEALGRQLSSAARAERLTPLPENRPLISGKVSETGSGFRAVYHNIGADSGRTAEITAHGRSGSVIARAPLNFAIGQASAEAEFELPADLRNRVAVLRAAGMASAGAVKLLDDSWGRPVIGIMTTGKDSANPLLSDSFYAKTALTPHADIFSGSLNELLPIAPSIIIMPDSAREESEEIIDYVETGGLLIRFAGAKLAARPDKLLPVEIRSGGRELGGALAWEDPQQLAPFPAQSPFFGLKIPEDITVSRQVMAQPGAQTDARTWARLDDGSPIVTSSSRGLGRVVLFHVTAGPEWSNLAVGGLYVEMLRRLLPLAGSAAAPAQNSDGSDWAPDRVLTGFGRLAAPPLTAQVLPDEGFDAAPISALHPAGLYRQGVRRRARNAAAPDKISLIPTIAGVKAQNYVAPKTQTLGGLLLALVLIMLSLDVLFSLLSSGRLGYLRPRFKARVKKSARKSAALGLALALLLPAALITAEPAQAQDSGQAAGLTEALGLHLAYVKTGNSRTDSLSEAAMKSLVNELTNRTTIEPVGARGVTLGVDPLVFYPFLYFPVERDAPELTDAASGALNAYMAAGGTVVFDTRDQGDRELLNAATHPGLKAVTKSLDIPQIGPVPDDHVLTKSFYLLTNFPGRWANGKVWVDKNRNGTAQDGVSSVIIGANDWAAGWAASEDGEFLISLETQMPRQREYALRFGVNLAMYALSGNYKADQVHSKELILRIEQREKRLRDLGRAQDAIDGGR